ncbi:uncharacterized protein LOC143853640 [Tasmannia lanceolata]|uniref:uncharacterized protein LOC143853640 n=1 Tax=Tasmannia lanceolata TaxID=3420 RepID=UPI004063D5D5
MGEKETAKKSNPSSMGEEEKKKPNPGSMGEEEEEKKKPNPGSMGEEEEEEKKPNPSSMEVIICLAMSSVTSLLFIGLTQYKYRLRHPILFSIFNILFAILFSLSGSAARNLLAARDPAFRIAGSIALLLTCTPLCYFVSSLLLDWPWLVLGFFPCLVPLRYLVCDFSVLVSSSRIETGSSEENPLHICIDITTLHKPSTMTEIPTENEKDGGLGCGGIVQGKREVPNNIEDTV